MSLRDKLARMRAAAQPAAPAPDLHERGVDSALYTEHAGHTDRTHDADLNPDKMRRLAELRALIGEVSERHKRRQARADVPALCGPAAAAVPAWPCIETEHGPLHVQHSYLEPEHHHGRAPVRAGLSAHPTTVAALLRDVAGAAVDLSSMLYLDTETTGLSGGTGTVAFLVGTARFVDGALVTEQLIVPQLGAETPVLARLAERIAAASCIVTYNGKSFDWPLLRTRFVLSRLPVPALPHHLDLLHVCRRLWKPRLSSVRLVDMEREILRFEREDDVPGSEIPARYFEFLRTGDATRLLGVLEHNRHDLVALAALLGVIARQFEFSSPLSHPSDALRYGRMALRAEDLSRAHSFARHGIEQCDQPSDVQQALLLGSEVARRNGQLAHAIALTEQAIALSQEPAKRARLHCTLAKWYEHELGDLERALLNAQHTEPSETCLQRERRVNRLQRKLARRAARAADAAQKVA